MRVSLQTFLISCWMASWSVKSMYSLFACVITLSMTFLQTIDYTEWVKRNDFVAILQAPDSYENGVCMNSPSHSFSFFAFFADTSPVSKVATMNATTTTANKVLTCCAAIIFSYCPLPKTQLRHRTMRNKGKRYYLHNGNSGSCTTRHINKVYLRHFPKLHLSVFIVRLPTNSHQALPTICNCRHQPRLISNSKPIEDKRKLSLEYNDLRQNTSLSCGIWLRTTEDYQFYRISGLS